MSDLKFVAIAKVMGELDRIRKYAAVDRLLSKLGQCGPLLLIGGAIRDSILGRAPRDFDFVVECRESALEPASRHPEVRRNGFGGFKAELCGVSIDFWSIETHWAFKKRLLPTHRNSLADSSFFNVDSAWLDIKTGEWGGHMFSALEEGILDILPSDANASLNPTRDLNVLRALVLCSEYKLRPSERVKNYVKQWIADVVSPASNLAAVARRHYGRDINEDFLCRQLDDYRQGIIQGGVCWEPLGFPQR